MMSSPVLTIMVRSRGSMTSWRPRRSFEAPTPPASAVIFSFLDVGIRRSDAGDGTVATRVSVRIGDRIDATANARRKKFVAADKFRIECETFAQDEATGLGFRFEARNLRPGRLGIDEIFGDGRDAAPVIDASVEQSWKIVIAEIGRGLHVHLRAEDQPSDGDRAQHVFERRFGVRGHGDFRLSAEILDDNFLDVTISLVERSNRKE